MDTIYHGELSLPASLDDEILAAAATLSDAELEDLVAYARRLVDGPDADAAPPPDAD